MWHTIHFSEKHFMPLVSQRGPVSKFPKGKKQLCPSQTSLRVLANQIASGHYGEESGALLKQWATDNYQ